MAVRRTLMIGRSDSCDIVIADETVSRQHAELVESGDGRLYLTDRNSSAGTWRKEGDAWIRIRQSFVEPEEPLMFGQHQTKASVLLTGAK